MSSPFGKENLQAAADGKKSVCNDWNMESIVYLPFDVILYSLNDLVLARKKFKLKHRVKKYLLLELMMENIWYCVATFDFKFYLSYLF